MRILKNIIIGPVAFLALAGGAVAVDLKVDYEAFLSRHDMTWNRLPNRWEVAPYTGNGNVGFLFYQAKGSAKNVISIHAGRHDYYDQRLPHKGDQML
jgi:alpha-L-fucosidase 2